MAANGCIPTPLACKCLNIRIQPQSTKDPSPPVEAGFTAIYVGEHGIQAAHPGVTLRTRSKPIPEPGSPVAELSRYTTITCLICGVPVYRVAQRITPDLVSEEGPVLPTEDWAEKELCKSLSGWIEVYQGCLTEDEIAQAKSSLMYSSLFGVVLPGGTPPSAAPASDKPVPDKLNARGPSEDGKTHLPELPPLFLPPPFTPSHVVFSHLSAVASERAQILRDEAEEHIARLTEQKVAEVLKAEAALKKEVELVWTRFRDSVRLYEQAGTTGKAGLPMRRRSSVSGHARSASQPPQTSASVRISSFVPTPTHSTRTSPTRMPVPSALSASLKTSTFHHPDIQRQLNGNGNSSSSSTQSSDSASPVRSSPTRVQSPFSASTRTNAVAIDAETSIREAYRREMNELKDIATSFRYVSGLEAEMEKQRLQAAAEEAEIPSPPVASGSQPAPESHKNTAGGAGRSPRVQKSALKHAGGERSKSPRSKAEDKGSAEEAKEASGKGKRKVTFDVQPEVAVLKDEAELSSGHPVPPEGSEDVMFDMDNESEHSMNTRIDSPAPVEQPTPQPTPPVSTAERVRSPRASHSRSSSNSGLPPQLSSLRPASLPAPSAMRTPQRNPTPPSTETAERSKALRESLVSTDSARPIAEVDQSPIEIVPETKPEEPVDPREAEILKLVAASTPSHRNAWKKNSKAWQVFFNRRERRAGEVGPEPISEEGDYVLDDFDPQGMRHPNAVLDSDVTDDDDDDKWTDGNDSYDHPIAQSLPIPIGLNHPQTFGRPQYQLKTSLSDRPGMLVPELRTNSSASVRRVSHIDRDPGALDFVAADDDDDDDDEVNSDPEMGGRSRQRALQILEARNELPPAGMWRSLA